MAGFFFFSMFVSGFASFCLCPTGSGGMFVRRLFADRSCGHVFINHKLHPAPWLNPVNDRAALWLLSSGCFVLSLTMMEANWAAVWVVAAVMLCDTMSLCLLFTEHIAVLWVEANCHNSVRCHPILISWVRKEPFWASIYLSLKIADFCFVRRNAVSRRARTQQVLHKNALCFLKGSHTYSILKQL